MMTNLTRQAWLKQSEIWLNRLVMILSDDDPPMDVPYILINLDKCYAHLFSDGRILQPGKSFLVL